jgi:DNA repair protein RadC
MKQKFLLNNGREMADHELLELFLYYSIPRRDTNETAHQMINAMGSLKDVFTTPTDKLLSVDGVGNETLTLIRVTQAINKRINMQRYESRQRFNCLSAVGEYLTKYYRGAADEQFCAMLLDNSMRLIDFVALESGTVNSVPFDARKLARVALAHDASRVIISHNHPAGMALPSAADHEITARAEAALAAIGIALVEHIIVGEVGYAPTMQARMTAMYSSSKSRNYEEGFLREFYSN